MAKTNLSKTVRENLPLIIASHGSPMNKKELRDAYVSHEGCASEYDFGSINNKSRWSKLRSAIHSQCPKLIKMGILHQPAKGKFDLVQGASIASSFVPFLNGQSAPVVVATPVVEPTPPVVEETPVVEVEETPVVAPVEPVAEVEETVEPMVEVSVPSSVQVSTTTLEPVAVVEETEPVAEVQEEVEDAPVEPVEVEEEVEATPVNETLVEDEIDLFGKEEEETQEEETQEEETQEDNEETQEEEDEQPSYDLKELRKSASFDPLSLTLKGVTGSYEVYRDMDARNIVLTQKGREDYVIVPVDVDQERVDALNEVDARYARYALKSVGIFDTATNHKDGCTPIVKALISCTNNCDHTDDFGGLVEPCMNPLDCPLQSIWGGVAIYVNPQDA